MIYLKLEYLVELNQSIYPWAKITIKYQVGTIILKTNNDELINMYSHIIIILEYLILLLWKKSVPCFTSRWLTVQGSHIGLFLFLKEEI